MYGCSSCEAMRASSSNILMNSSSSETSGRMRFSATIVPLGVWMARKTSAMPPMLMRWKTS